MFTFRSLAILTLGGMLDKIKVAAATAGVGAVLGMAALAVANQAQAANLPHGSYSVGGAGATETEQAPPTTITMDAKPAVKAQPWHGGKWKVGPGGW